MEFGLDGFVFEDFEAHGEFSEVNLVVERREDIVEFVYKMKVSS